MSEESEKAAKWDMLMRNKELTAHLATLRSKAEEIGKALQSFGTVLANPSWKFTVSEDKIVGKTTLIADASPLILPTAYLDSEDIAKLLRDIEETQKSIAVASKNLADAGV